jgi:hypothetical protein
MVCPELPDQHPEWIGWPPENAKDVAANDVADRLVLVFLLFRKQFARVVGGHCFLQARWIPRGWNQE